MHRTRFCPPPFAIAIITFCGASAFATPPTQVYTLYGGHPRPWQAGVQAHPNSLVNMASMNVLTSVPLFAWSGKGPAISVSIYHNSYAAVSGVSSPAGAGFTLGTGWRISYGGQVVSVDANNTRVIEDDGTVNAYTKSGSDWIAPAGRRTVATDVSPWTPIPEESLRPGGGGGSATRREPTCP